MVAALAGLSTMTSAAAAAAGEGAGVADVLARRHSRCGRSASGRRRNGGGDRKSGRRIKGVCCSPRNRACIAEAIGEAKVTALKSLSVRVISRHTLLCHPPSPNQDLSAHRGRSLTTEGKILYMLYTWIRGYVDIARTSRLRALLGEVGATPYGMDYDVAAGPLAALSLSLSLAASLAASLNSPSPR